MEYDEVARAESERGEVVLRRRRDPDDPDGPVVLELRVNGVFVMDTVETSTERELAAAALAQVDEPRAVAGGRARPRASPCTRCWPTPASSGSRSSRSRTPWSAGCATAPSRTAPATSPTSG